MIISNKVILRERTLAEAWNDYTWDTDPELAQLDAAPVIKTTFSQYLSDYASELRHSVPTSRRFAMDTLNGQHIGNCSYYNISETRGEAELGIMIGNRDYWNKGYGTDVVTALVNHIFSETQINRIYLKTLQSNDRAQKCFQKCGFTRYGNLNKDGYSFVLMKIQRDEWNSRLKTD